MPISGNLDTVPVHVIWGDIESIDSSPSSDDDESSEGGGEFPFSRIIDGSIAGKPPQGSITLEQVPDDDRSEDGEEHPLYRIGHGRIPGSPRQDATLKQIIGNVLPEKGGSVQDTSGWTTPPLDQEEWGRRRVMHPLFDLPSDDAFPLDSFDEWPSSCRDGSMSYSALSQPQDVDGWNTPQHDQDKYFRSQLSHPVKVDLPSHNVFGEKFKSTGSAGFQNFSPPQDADGWTTPRLDQEEWVRRRVLHPSFILPSEDAFGGNDTSGVSDVLKGFPWPQGAAKSNFNVDAGGAIGKRASATENNDGDRTFPEVRSRESRGSLLHWKNECTPCLFAHTSINCRHGASCGFCHLSHSGGSRPSKAKRNRYRKLVSRIERGIPDREA